MYVDDIEILAERKENTEDPDTNDKNIQPGCRNGIWHLKM